MKKAGSRTLSGILLILVLAAGYAIKTVTPNADFFERPFITSGPVGEIVTTRQFSAKVISVRYATELKEGSKTFTTGGVFVLARVSFTATIKETHIGFAQLESGDGRTFAATDRVTQNMVERSAVRLQPGIPVEGEVVFEIARSALGPGMSIRFATEEGFEVRMEGMVEIPLTSTEGAPWVEPKTVTYDPAVKR
ncbi:DUF4352 domain-containing protein [Catelliglobosispora koreensis]|uniref:DUF4352 domain-containing protein n=1 Tax=Catelliglobosispora koreensis TaxID=129052 RepID=UPI00036E6072|nr:DUF4352 domain-containing protein [Catelliglobosispora koreensis]